MNSKNILWSFLQNFFEENPKCLRFLDDLGHEALHKHSECVFTSIEALIDCCSTDPEKFTQILDETIRPAHANITRKHVKKLNQIIKNHFLSQVEKHKTKTLNEALELFLKEIELRFEES